MVDLLTVAGLLLFGLLLILCELFIPGGVVGLTGVILIAIAVVVAGKSFGSGVATLLSLLCILGGMLGFWLWVRYFPTSRFGRLISLNDSLDQKEGFSSQPPEWKQLSGRQGVAISPLRPSGTISIDDQRYAATTEGQFLPAGTEVIVARVDSNRIVVEPRQ